MSNSDTAQTSLTAFRGSRPFVGARHRHFDILPGAGRSARSSPVSARPERFTFCEDDLIDVDPEGFGGLSDWQIQFEPKQSLSTSPLGTISK